MPHKILLIKIERESVYNPLGLLYVGSYLKKQGYDVEVEIVPESDFAQDGYAGRKASSIAKQGYLFVGFSVLTGPQTKWSAVLSRELKRQAPLLAIVWGGIHPSLMSRQTLAESYVDIVVIGEGEETAAQLADHLARGADLDDVKGIGYKDSGKEVFTGVRDLIPDLDRIEIDWSLVDIEKCLFQVPGRSEKGFIYLTSRGCPHNCSFCYNDSFNKRRWRVHSVERVVKDLGMLKERFGINSVAFMDDHFFVDKTRSFDVLARLKSMGITCSEFLLRIDEVSLDTVKKLDELGVRRLFIGVESGSDRILALMRKNTDRAMIIEKFKILSRYSTIAINCALIIGYPTETMKEIEESIDLGVELSGMLPGIVTTFQTFLPYPGTDAYALAVENGFRPPDRTEDYEVYDTFGKDLPLSWLPWADSHTGELFYRIDKYGKLLTHSASTSVFRTIAKRILYRMAKARLKRRFFAFPFEIGILFRFNRYYNPTCKI